MEVRYKLLLSKSFYCRIEEQAARDRLETIFNYSFELHSHLNKTILENVTYILSEIEAWTFNETIVNNTNINQTLLDIKTALQNISMSVASTTMVSTYSDVRHLVMEVGEFITRNNISLELNEETGTTLLNEIEAVLDTLENLTSNIQATDQSMTAVADVLANLTNVADQALEDFLLANDSYNGAKNYSSRMDKVIPSFVICTNNGSWLVEGNPRCEGEQSFKTLYVVKTLQIDGRFVILFNCAFNNSNTMPKYLFFCVLLGIIRYGNNATMVT